MHDSPVGCHEPMFAFGKRRLLARPQTGQIFPSQPYKTGFTQSKAGFFLLPGRREKKFNQWLNWRRKPIRRGFAAF